MDSNASKRTPQGTKSRATPAADGAADTPQKIRAAGSASAVPRSGSLRGTPKQAPQPLPVTAEESADQGEKSGPFNLNRTFSKLFGGGGETASGQEAATAPRPAKTSQEPASSYDQETPTEGRFFGLPLVGKKAPEPTPHSDPDTRRTRYNSRATPVVKRTSLTDNMTDLMLDGDDAEDTPKRPLGLGRMSSREARAPRSRHQSLLPEPVHEEQEEGGIAFPTSAQVDRRASKASQQRDRRASAQNPRVSRVASAKRSSRPLDKAPQLPPVLAVGSSNFSDIVGDADSLEPDYIDDAPVSRNRTGRPSTATTAGGHITEEEDDVFEDVDPQAFPVTPTLAQQQRDDPFAAETESADVHDDEATLPLLTGRNLATIGAAPIADEQEEEDIPSYDQTIAKEPPREKVYGDKKIKPAAAAATGGAALGGLAGAFAARTSAEEGSTLSDDGVGDETVPGAFSSARTPAAAATKGRSGVPVDEGGVPLNDVDDQPPPPRAAAAVAPAAADSDASESEIEPPTKAEVKRHRELAAAGLLGAGGAGAAALAASKKSKSKSAPRYEDEDDGEEVSPVPAASSPPLQRHTSPPPPDKPQKSQARKQKAAAADPAAAAVVPAEVDDAKKRKAQDKALAKDRERALAKEKERERALAKEERRNRKNKHALAAGAGAGGAAAAAAAARDRNRDRDHDHYDEDPAILTDDDADDFDDDHDDMYDEIKYASKPSKKSSNGTKKKRTPAAAAASARPTKRSSPVKSLSPIQRHYLIKALVSIQMQAEWEELEKLGSLTLYGAPFTAERPKLTRVKTEFKNEYTSNDDVEDQADDPYADDNDVARKMENLHEPLILRHLFHTHLMTLPGLGEAPLPFWQKRIQVFFDEMAARNFSTSIERGEYSKRRFYSLAATRYLGGYFARGVGVRGQGELRGPGPGEKGSERWGAGKQWGKGTVKRGLDRPARIDQKLWSRIDGLFGDGAEGNVWRRAGRESQRTRGDWQAWKEQIIENETGLEETINFLDISSIRNLPPKYRNAEEWARNHAAYLLHSLFVTAPNADSVFGVLKGVHSLFPYWGAKQLLKYANAQVLIEGILNLLLARPAGAKSLIQRIATYVIGSEATTIAKEYLAPLRKDINDPELVSRIDEYVQRGSRPEGRALRSKAEKTGDDILTVIMLTAEGKSLSREVQDKVIELQHAFARSPYRGCLDYAYPASTPFAKENPEKMQIPRWEAHRVEQDEARKFAQLKLYLRESLKKRDRQEAVKMASGALVPTIIKDFLQTVMYDIIKQVANQADLSGRLGDLQAFLDDLIDIKKKKDDSLQAWIALAARHENSLYYFVHECASIAGPLFEWCQIGLDYMALSTTDPVHPADRSAKNIELNLEELLQDSRLSEKDVELILEEVDELAVYTKWSKVAYELELRKNFLLARSDSATNSKLTEDDIPSTTMKEEIQDIDALMRELMEAEGVPVDDGSLPNESRGTEARELSTLWFDVMDPLGQHLRAEGDAPELRYEPKYVGPPVPCLKYVRKALPAFNDMLRDRLPVYRQGPTTANSGNGTAAGKGSSYSKKPSLKGNTSSKEPTKNKFSIF